MDAIISAVDLATVATGLGTIGAAIAVVLVARMGIKKLLGMIK